MTTPPEEVARSFDLDEAPALAPRYNIAPGQDVAVVRASPGGEARVLEMLRWGLVPHWARDPKVGARMINARSETAAEKPAFRDALRRQRCLVPADGFFEWRKASRQPFHIQWRDGALFGIAGLWDTWADSDGGEVRSCTLLTTAANAEIAELHDRMPVILESGDWARWLDPEPADPDELRPLLRPRPDGELLLHPVSRRVNRPIHDDPACIATAAREPDAPSQLGLEWGPAEGDA